MELGYREPAVAGMFYERDSHALKAHLQKLFSNAKSAVSDDEVAAVIVPHAGYVFSGGVAASAFNQIPPDTKFERVFLIGSSHRMAFDGASVYSSGGYTTPLGNVEVDQDVANKMVGSSSFISADPAAHIQEHSLEVELPFLQYHLKHPFKLVPVVMGSHEPAASAEMAKVLKQWFRAGNLFVISTDFSHYPGYEDAVEVDKRTARAIVENDPRKFLETLDDNQRKGIAGLATSSCGWASVLTLLHLTHLVDEIYYRHIEYKNSGDSQFGEKDKVVGYNAIVVFRKKSER